MHALYSFCDALSAVALLHRVAALADWLVCVLLLLCVLGACGIFGERVNSIAYYRHRLGTLNSLISAEQARKVREEDKLLL
jgi:hypothetical protein